MAPQLEAPTSIPVPSADLINYRFDQTDKKFEDMNRKLDQILLQNAHFMTEVQIEKLIDDALKPTRTTLENWRWYWRAMVTAVLLAFLTAIAGFVLHRG